MKPTAALKILEIGQFCLFKRALPDQTTLVFTGEDFAPAAGLDCRVFTPALLPWLRRSLAEGAWDLVVCHVPVRPVWERRHGLAAAVGNLRHRLLHVRTLGTYALRGRLSAPLVLLDFNDEPVVPSHVFPLLDRAALYFKRELPIDHAKLFLDATRRHRTHAEVMASPFVARNIGKLRPISIAVSEETARLALAVPADKKTDVFFAGTVNSAVRAAGLPILRAMATQGFAIDVSGGGLPKSEYLARAARAWLSWSPEGFGWECLRHYEVSLCRSVPVLSQPGIHRHRPLLDGVHAIAYRPEGEDLRRAVTAALADKPALAAMAAAARDHALHHHTHRRAVEHILDSVVDAARPKSFDSREPGL